MIVFKPEVAAKLRTAAQSLERIGQLLPERAQSALSECAAILEVCADDYAPRSAQEADWRNPSDWQEAPEQVPVPKQAPAREYPDSARQSAARLAGRMKPPPNARPSGIGRE